MKILICSLNGSGNLNPAVGLALNLQQRGHQTAFVTDLSCVAELEAQGLTRIQRGNQDGSSFQAALWGQPLSAAIQVKHIEYAIDAFAPDVLIGQQLTLGPFIASVRRNLPLAVLGLATYLWPLSVPSAEKESWSGNIFARLRGDGEARKARRLEAHISLLAQVRALFHLAVNSCAADMLLGDLFLLRSMPQLEGNIDNLPDRVHLVGPCLWENSKRNMQLEKWLLETEKKDSPLIYVYQGRFFDQPHFWPKLVDALGTQPVRVVASTANMDCPVGEVPPNFFVSEDIPQGYILRQAKAMISSANTTSVLSALTAGVPSLLIPAGGEQPDVAARCETAGVARSLRPEAVSKQRLLSELEFLLNDSRIQDAARRLSDNFRQANTFDHASYLIEMLAATRKPVLRSRVIGLEASA